MEKTVLIVDDDAKLRSLLTKYLEGYGFTTLTAADGSAMYRLLERELPDIIILDIMLGKENGLDLLKAIRQQWTIPVIMLTAKGEDTDRIVGLELGADDYLPKPFNPRELLARMHSVMRRSVVEPLAEKTPRDETCLTFGELSLNTAKRTLGVKGCEIALSTTEYQIVYTLIRYPNRVYSRDELLNIARGKDFMAFDRSIDVHISNLRSKIGKVAPELKKMIKTVWGSGYMLEESQ